MNIPSSDASILMHLSNADDAPTTLPYLQINESRDSHDLRSKGGIRDSSEKKLGELQDDILRIE
jgi:hypothetical protein